MKNYKQLIKVMYLKDYKYHTSRNLRKLGVPFSYNDLKIRLLKNSFSNKVCFILGSGPSMKIEYLELLKNYNTFAFNQIFKVFKYTDWRPSFYVIGDGIIAENHRDSILKIDSKYLFVSDHIKNILNGNDNIIYFRKSHETESVEPPFSPNMLDVVEGGFTVTYLAMQIAYYLGFREIFLLGVDNNYAPVDISISGDLGPYKVVNADFSQSYFIPDMVSKSEKTLLPPDLKIQRLAYMAANKFFKENDVKIYNGALDSPMDIFPYKDFRLALKNI